MVGLIIHGLLTASGESRTIWVSPVAGENEVDLTSSGMPVLVRAIPVPRQMHDDYYLTVGAARVWMILHSILVRLPIDALEDGPWQRFVEVSRRVATAVANLAPADGS